MALQFGGFVAGSRLDPNFENLAASGPASERALWPFWAKSWPGAFWSQILAIWRLLGRNEKRLLELLGNGPCWAKSWPGALWSKILAICRCLEAFGKLLGSFWQTPGNRRQKRAPGNRRAPVPSARRPENTKAQAFFTEKLFPVERVEPEAVFAHFELYFAFLKRPTSFWQPETFKRSL